MQAASFPGDRVSSGRVSRQIVVLLAVALFINYIDRGNLATAAPLLKGDLRLSTTQVGFLLSAFFWTYAPLQLIAGWMVERFDVHRLLAGALAVWSVATAASGLAGSFGVLLSLRLLLGLGESLMHPGMAKLVGLRVQNQQRGKANGTIAVGQALGPAFGTLFGGLLMAQFGWRAVMVTFGALSLLWLWPWLGTTWRLPSTVAAAGAGKPPSYAMILHRREAWGACLGQFCNNYSLYFVLSWLPLFLVKSRGFSMAEMSQIGAAVYCVYALSSAFTGWASDRLVLSGRSSTLARKSFIIASSVGTAGCLFAAIYATPMLAIICLLVTGLFFGLGTPMLWVIAQTLAGPRATGQWMGVQNFSGNLAGILAPLLTGFLVDRTGDFAWAFDVAGAISLIGALAWGVVILVLKPSSGRCKR